MRIRCPKCGAEWESAKEIVGVRDECPQCAAYLHTCMSCKHFDPRLRDCRVPNTESVRDREAQNFCEEFAYEGAAGAKGSTSAARSAEEARKRFEQLFGDTGT